jgi:hypothetical protein
MKMHCTFGGDYIISNEVASTEHHWPHLAPLAQTPDFRVVLRAATIEADYFGDLCS